MNKPSILSTAVVSTIAAFVLATPVAASAQAAPTGRDFGHHVAECAQTTGMDATHNPGMHRGFTGWDAMPC